MKLDDSKNKMTLQELIDTKNFINQLSVDCELFWLSRQFFKNFIA